MKRWAALMVGLALPALSAQAEIEQFQNDGYEVGDAITYLGDVQPGEIAAVRFEPQIECPCLVTEISLVFAGAEDPQNIGFKIWQDAEGTAEPGTLMLHDFTTLTPSDSAIQTVDVSDSGIVVNGPFRVGIQSLNFGLPAVVTDTDGNLTADANFLLANNGTFDWSFTAAENMGGDFIIRAAIDNVVLDDVDADGVANAQDNCILRSNADQRDTDGDAIGNFCDADVAVPNDCVINFQDFVVYRDNFERVGDLDTDNNGDGVTNFIDFAVFASYFLAAPGPSAAGCN